MNLLPLQRLTPPHLLLFSRLATFPLRTQCRPLQLFKATLLLGA
jgi:hypothetical protein